MNEMSVPHRPTANPGPELARQAVLSVSKGSKIYGGVHAIEAVDFDLYPGEVHALVGENGAGKSTLCKAIAAAIKLTSGTYCVDGRYHGITAAIETAKGLVIVSKGSGRLLLHKRDARP